MARIARSLDTLRSQVNSQWPSRSKSHDGWIGDAAHASRKSDHNPNSAGVVCALDLTNDPGHGFISGEFADSLRENRDPRIKYVISDGRIFNSTNWKWEKYSGSNPHRTHVHISVGDQYDNPDLWEFGDQKYEITNLPVIRKGDKGRYVTLLQAMLWINTDGDFGPNTESRVKQFQKEYDLMPDGIVGPQSWTELVRPLAIATGLVVDTVNVFEPEVVGQDQAGEIEFGLEPYPPPFPPESADLIKRCCSIAMASPIANYSWKNRGKAPPGYTKGMAVAFAIVVRKLLMGEQSALECAKADTHNKDKDALSWYDGVFNSLHMDNSVSGLDTLRHLFVLQMGLGMRESSGKYCVGRDTTASNVSADTAEAGLFQMSWNARSCSSQMQVLMDEYFNRPPQCNLNIFSENVTCSSKDWKSYGSGAGYNYQELAKHCPQFAVETTALALRHIRKHWGPINRYEAEVRKEADEMFIQIQELVTAPSV